MTWPSSRDGDVLVRHMGNTKFIRTMHEDEARKISATNQAASISNKSDDRDESVRARSELDSTSKATLAKGAQMYMSPAGSSLTRFCETASISALAKRKIVPSTDASATAATMVVDNDAVDMELQSTPCSPNHGVQTHICVSAEHTVATTG